MSFSYESVRHVNLLSDRLTCTHDNAIRKQTGTNGRVWRPRGYGTWQLCKAGRCCATQLPAVCYNFMLDICQYPSLVPAGGSLEDNSHVSKYVSAHTLPAGACNK
jgi:hypothetical protein